MRKIIFCLLFLAAGSITAKSQLRIEGGATFFIGAGATVTVQGDVTSNADIQGTGLLQLKGTTLQNVDMAGFTIPNLELDNAANARLVNTNARIGSSIVLTNGRLRLENQTLRIASSITSVAGASSSRFIETNGTGVLTKEGLGSAAFVYPVGFSGTEFNPLSIANTGAADDISIRCLEHVLANGLSGAPVASDFANNSWVITEAVAGGSNLALTGEWVLGDELPGFNRAKSGIARYNTGTDWDLPASNVIGASGSGPYSRNRSSIVTPGVFAPADLEFVNAANLNIKVLLSGPYAGAANMLDGLRTNSVIPLTQPYSNVMGTFFNRSGSVYDGSASVNESVNATSVFDVAGTNDDIVDWVFLSLQDGTTPATRLQTRAALLQRDGDIVEYNPLTLTYIPVRMPINSDGNYHLVIGHRNHLPIRTPVSQLLQDNTTFVYNFSDAQAKAFQDPVIIGLPSPNNNPAMLQNGTAFLMWPGNAVVDNFIRFTSSTFPPIPSDAANILTLLGGNPNLTGTTYSVGDINMDGRTRFTSSTFPPIPSDAAVILSTSLSGNPNATRRAHQ